MGCKCLFPEKIRHGCGCVVTFSIGICVEIFLVVEGEAEEGSELIASAHPYAVVCVCGGKVCNVVGKGH